MGILTRLEASVDCLFCRKTFTPKQAPPEHVIPKSLYGTLTTYYVCRACNGYFGQKLESSLQEYPEVRTAKKRLGIGPPRKNPPLKVTNIRAFKRFLGKVALEFIGETNYQLAMDPGFNRWRDFVRRNNGGSEIENRITYEDLFQSLQGFKPVAERSWHAILLIEIQGELLCEVNLYSQLLTKVWFGPTPAGKRVGHYEMIQSIRRKPRRGENRHLLHQLKKPLKS
jgi:hypothetical protein